MLAGLCPFTVPATTARTTAKNTALRICTPLTHDFELSEATYRPLTVANCADSMARRAWETIEGNPVRGKPILSLQPYSLPLIHFSSNISVVNAKSAFTVRRQGLLLSSRAQRGICCLCPKCSASFYASHSHLIAFSVSSVVIVVNLEGNSTSGRILT
jgi:hypothetical protein